MIKTASHTLRPIRAAVLFAVAFNTLANAAVAPSPSPPALKVAPAVIDASLYPSLQAALDAVPASGGLVRLPPGDFELERPLVLTRGDTRIVGAGTATHLINRNTRGEPALIIRPGDRAQNRRSRIWRFHVENFRISGSPASGDGLRMEGVNELFVHALSIDHNGGHGLNLIDCTEDPRVANSIFTYNKQVGLNIENSHDLVVIGNQFEENQDALHCRDSFNLALTGNIIDDHLRHGVVIENTYGSVLSGNMIEECQGTAIILDRDCYGITISANVIAHNLGGGVDLRDAWGCAVSANTFVLVQPDSITVRADSGRITITGNNFTNSHIGGRAKLPPQHANPMGRDGAGGVVLQNTRDIVITGNSFSGLGAEAVRAEGECERLVITSNVITDLHRLNPGPNPAIALGRATASIVKDNAIAPGFASR